MSMTIPLISTDGLDARFLPVREVFEACLRDRPAGGAALCVYLEGRPVIDIWGGSTWSAGTSHVLFSASKGVLAVCIGVLVEQGRLLPDKPVSRYWPEFAAGGKEQVTVRQLMAHEAGLPTVTGGYTLEEMINHEPLAARLAAQVPLWEPGSAHGYHACTLGTLGRELVRRVTGCSTADFLAREVAQPLGLDLWFGLPVTQQQQVAPIRPPRLEPAGENEAESRQREVLPRDFDVNELDRPTVRAADLPAVSAVSTARSLARMYAACVGDVDGTNLLSPSTLSQVMECRTGGTDVVTLEESRFGMGFQLPFARLPFGGPGSFGHDGHGGALAFGHQSLQLGFGFLTDQMPAVGGADPYALRLAEALLECLGTDVAVA